VPPDPILKFEAIDQAENLSAFADLFNSLRAITALSSLLCRITFSMGWAAWDAKIVSICKSSAVWSIGLIADSQDLSPDPAFLKGHTLRN